MSTTILNAATKKSVNLLKAPRILSPADGIIDVVIKETGSWDTLYNPPEHYHKHDVYLWELIKINKTKIKQN